MPDVPRLPLPALPRVLFGVCSVGSKISVLEAVKLVKEKREWLLTNRTFQRALIKLASSAGLLHPPPLEHLSSLKEEEEEEEEDGDGDEEEEKGAKEEKERKEEDDDVKR